MHWLQACHVRQRHLVLLILSHRMLSYPCTPSTVLADPMCGSGTWFWLSSMLLSFMPTPPTVLADPMCGSGTFLIEAALMATGTAPGSFRRWWPFTQASGC